MAASDLSHRYLWGPAADMLLADEQVTSLATAGSTYWALADHLGSVRDVVDSSGDLRIHRQFDSFGNIVAETHYNASGSVVTEGQAGYVDVAFAYTGRYLDPTTGLQNNLHRWYDASVGRWISEDPIGFAAGDANLSRYVGNEPTGWVDPSGLVIGGPSGISEHNEEQSFFDMINGIIWGYDVAKHAELDHRIRDLATQEMLKKDPFEQIEALEDIKEGRLANAAEDAKQLAETAVEFNAAALGGGFVRGGASQIDRAAFRAEREAFWKAEALNNPGKYSADDLLKMRMGRAPTGPDGYPIELHHIDRTPEGGVRPMSRTDHRLGENYRKNHPPNGYSNE